MKENVQSLKTIVFLMVLGGVIGYIYTQVVYFSQPNPEGSIWLGITIGMGVSGLSAIFEIIFVDKPESKIRDLPFWASFLIRVVTHLLLIVLVILLVQLTYSKLIGTPFYLIGQELGDTLTDIGFSFIIIALIIFWLQMRVFIGARTLKNLIIGKYDRPQLEECIFMIVDVAGSTSAAQDIGDRKFHEFLNRLFILFDAAIHKNDGEVHSYVGDAIFIVWPFSQDKNVNARAFKTLCELHQICIAKQNQIIKEFGIKPKIRAAIHGGPIVIGEMGQRKRQITYLGNTLNLTARLEGLAKELDTSYLVSDEVLDRSNLPKNIHVNSLGQKSVKGSAKKLAVSQIVIEAN